MPDDAPESAPPAVPPFVAEPAHIAAPVDPPDPDPPVAPSPAPAAPSPAPAAPSPDPDPPVASSAPADAPDLDTPATRALAGTGLRYEARPSGAPRSVEDAAAIQGVPVSSILRTIVVRRAADDYLFVLVPGGRRIHWPRLRALLGVSRMSLPDADEARAATGYERGTITPFGARVAWPIVADVTLRGAGRVVLGGGRRGVTLHVDGDDLLAFTGATVADISEPASEAG